MAANGGSSTAARLPDGAVLRLFQFRPAHGEFDRTLRTEMLPDLRKLPGLIDVHVGRHGSSELGDRIVASIWQDRASMVRAIGGSLWTSTFHPEHLSETTDQVLEVHSSPSRSGSRHPRPRPSCASSGGGAARELEPYIEESRAGTIADRKPVGVRT